MTRLDRLYHPKTIAVIGGGTWCKNVILQCQKMGFLGDIYPVHPTKDQIAGMDCYARVADLPTPPDASFVGVNRNITIEIVQQLSGIGASGAVCFASGFKEATAEDAAGADLQAALLKAAGDMVVLGPNCYGFINYLDGALLWPDEHGGTRVDSGVAIVTQSSNIAINLTMQKRGLPIAFVATAGNQAQTGLSQIGQALLDDPRVTALGLHIEGIDDLVAFQALAKRARQLGKPIVALKVGASDQAQAATISHTASLAGSQAGATALFKRLGIAQVNSLGAFLEALKLVHTVGPLASTNIASMSCSGGEASLIADAALNTQVIFPSLTKAQTDRLGSALGPMVALSNPLDYHTYIWGDLEKMTDTYAAMMEPHIAIGLLILDFPRADRTNPQAWTDAIPALIAARDLGQQPMGILASIADTMPEDVAVNLIAKGIVPFAGIEDALAAIAAVGSLSTNPDPMPIACATAPKNPKPVFEQDAKAALREYGVDIPCMAVNLTTDQLDEACGNVGFPLVLKGQGLAHKTEANAVALNLIDTVSVLKAAAAMPTDTFLIEEMIDDAVCELLVGVVLDPAHGYILTLSAGGVLTELLNDATSLVLPTRSDDVMAALNDLKIAKLIHGYRGKPAANMDAIVAAVMDIQSYVLDHIGEVAEVEVNPLICTQTRAIAVDALITKGQKL